MSEEERQEELRRARKFNRIALLGLLAVFVVGAALGIARKGHTFSTEQWLAEPADRTKIVDDLLENYSLVGMTEEEVLGSRPRRRRLQNRTRSATIWVTSGD